MRNELLKRRHEGIEMPDAPTALPVPAQMPASFAEQQSSPHGAANASGSSSSNSTETVISGWIGTRGTGEVSFLVAALAVTAAAIAAHVIEHEHEGDGVQPAPDADPSCAFAMAFGVAAIATLGCVVKAVSTTSARKAALAQRLGLHLGAVCAAMGASALGIVHVVHLHDSRIHVVAHAAWLLTSASVAHLFHRLAFYTANAGTKYRHPGSDQSTSDRGPLLISVVAVARECATVAARLYPKSCALPALVGTVLVLVGVSALIKVSVLCVSLCVSAVPADVPHTNNHNTERPAYHPVLHHCRSAS